jgi:hypothetical protein
MEGGLTETALTQPELSFAGQKPIAKELGIKPRSETFHEATMLGNEDGFDIIRMREKVGRDLEESPEGNVAVSAAHGWQIHQRPRPTEQRRMQKMAALGTWRPNDRRLHMPLDAIKKEMRTSWRKAGKIVLG